MSLVEILIASAMALICIVAIIVSYLAVLNWSEINRQETIAMMHLTNIMETIKSTPFNNIITKFPNGVADGPTSNQYATIVGGYTLASEHIKVSYVDITKDPLEITAKISWNNASGISRARYLVTKRTK